MASGKRFLVWGAGGHGLVVADVIRAAGGDVVGYVDGDPAKLGHAIEPGGARVLLSEEALVAGASEALRRYGADCLALGIGRNAARERALRRIASPADAPPLLHPASVVSASARVGLATLIGARAVVNAAAAVGAGVIVNTGAIVEHECEVADAVHLSPGSVLCGGVRVGARAWIGAGAVVTQGVEIGADAVVGAGAIVIRDVPAGSTVVGNPARLIRSSTVA
jgi:sugar O-acyltransferase (sialic acid O-acetyltransferase NeuD family)